MRRIMITAVGAALVWCDYHWFTDVVAGWALSALLIELTLGINRAHRGLPHP